MERDRHVRFLRMMYDTLPINYEEQEINHLTLAYFVISGLNILDVLHFVIDKDLVVEWVLSFQVHPTGDESSNDFKTKFYGFHGSRSIQIPSENNMHFNHDGGHLASTYSALAILKTVGYNLSCINSELILNSMKTLQQHDGSFMPTNEGAEKDLRFVYCAASICFMLNNWSGMEREKAKDFILSCQSYDGGFGLVPGSESHGGATYCAVAALRLMGFIGDNLLSEIKTTSSPKIFNVSLLLEWCLQRQAIDGGFQGRINKSSDTCYAFWIGGVLRIMGAEELIDKKALRNFLLTCQTRFGGFGKVPEDIPDLYHSYYGISACSLLEEPGFKPFCASLGIADIGL